MTFEVDPRSRCPSGCATWRSTTTGAARPTWAPSATSAPSPRGTPIRLEVSGIDRGRPHMVANRNFVRWIRFRFNNLHSPGYHLTDLASAMLLQQGLSPLHCSSFRVGESTVVVVAARHGQDAHDDAGSGGGGRLPRRGPRHHRRHDAVLVPVDQHVPVLRGPVEELAQSLPHEAGSGVSRPPNCSRPRPTAARSTPTSLPTGSSTAPITHVAISRDVTGRRGSSIRTRPRALLNLNRYEFPYLKNPHAARLLYFHPEFDLRALVQREESVLEGWPSRRRRCRCSPPMLASSPRRSSNGWSAPRHDRRGRPVSPPDPGMSVPYAPRAVRSLVGWRAGPTCSAPSSRRWPSWRSSSPSNPTSTTGWSCRSWGAAPSSGPTPAGGCGATSSCSRPGA